MPSFDVVTTEDVTAYTVQVDADRIHLTDLSVGTAIPAGNAVVVKAAASGEYNLPVVKESQALPQNDLLVTAEPLVATGTQYVLGKSSESGRMGFGQVATGTTIPAGVGYLEISPLLASEITFFGLDGDNELITGIESTETACESKKAIYNLQGIRVTKLEKGVYIQNGKKIIIK